MYHNIRTVLYHGTISEIEKVKVGAGRLISSVRKINLCEACLLELEENPEAMYEYIRLE